MWKYAIDFTLTVNKDGSREFDDASVVSNCHWLYGSFEFEYDYWEWWNDEEITPKLKGLKPGLYHVFEWGEASEEWSEHWEYGREFDGFTFEPKEECDIVFVCDLYEEEI